MFVGETVEESERLLEVKAPSLAASEVTDVMRVEGTVWVITVVTSSEDDSVVGPPVMDVRHDGVGGGKGLLTWICCC